jgi:hypothetical protein
MAARRERGNDDREYSATGGTMESIRNKTSEQQPADPAPQATPSSGGRLSSDQSQIVSAEVDGCQKKPGAMRVGTWLVGGIALEGWCRAGGMRRIAINS